MCHRVYVCNCASVCESVPVLCCHSGTRYFFHTVLQSRRATGQRWSSVNGWLQLCSAREKVDKLWGRHRPAGAAAATAWGCSAFPCLPAMLSRWKLFGIMSDGSPYQVKWAKRAPLAYQTHIGAGTTDRLADRRADRRTGRRVAGWTYYRALALCDYQQRLRWSARKSMQRNCGQNSQQILNWFAGEKQTENAGERNMNVKRAVHALIHTDTHSHTQPHTTTHRHTQTHTYANGFTAPLCCCCFSFVFPPTFFVCVFWIRYCVLVLLWNHAV